jgi:hypothetical protein
MGYLFHYRNYHRDAVVLLHAGIRLHQKDSCMHTMLDAPMVGAVLFHSRCGGFPLLLCSYALLDENGNDTADFGQVVVIRVTALNGERFRLRDRDDIRRFLAAIGRCDAEVLS